VTVGVKGDADRGVAEAFGGRVAQNALAVRDGLHAVHCYLPELDGRVENTRAANSRTARLATSILEQRYLNVIRTGLEGRTGTSRGGS
jgi:hypothetical protein